MTSRFFVFGLFTTLGVVAWSGCGPGSETRYYCDDLGCYTCDAYGCSDVAAPTPKACTGATSCGPGETCTSTGCLTTCSDDAACGEKSGQVCKNGFCQSPTQKDPPKTIECTTKTDCGDGKVCTENKCVACGGTAGPCPCAATADCTGGLTCVAGKCTAPENVCKYSSECADGKLCADGQCLTSCATTPCADGFTCTKGVCQPGATGGGTQPTTCSNDDVCGAGKFCDQGICVTDTRPTPINQCSSDTQCTGTPARKCIGGYCKYTCTDSSYCLTIDSRIGVCAKDGVCRSAQEANASCIDASGCTGGQSCIDNQCK